MQEFKSQLAKVGFARRHLGKVATIGLAAVVARVVMPKPAKADWDDGRYWDRGDPGGHHCFLKGTKIRTARGECVVEELAIGDLLPTHRNGVRPITWIGRVNGDRPVRIARSAIARNLPHADLYVSQGHAVLVDDNLITAGSLVNGLSIVYADDIDEPEYFHVKLQSHDAIYAEGLPCETFVESADERDLLVLDLGGSRSQVKSHLRSAVSPWVDYRDVADILRDRLEERVLLLG